MKILYNTVIGSQTVVRITIIILPQSNMRTQIILKILLLIIQLPKK